MNKLLAALIVAAFAFASTSVLAQDKAPTRPIASDSDMVPLTKMDTEKAKAARAAAKAKWDAMTPDEKAAAKKAAQAKHQQELTAIDELVIKGEGGQYNTKQGAADAAASKAQPTPSKAERQADLTKSEKASASPSGVSKQ